MLLLARCILGVVLTGFALQGLPQAYPGKPVRIIVPLAPGGAADLLARFVSPGLTSSLGKPVVVENRAGGGGHIGSEFVARSPADGYTLLIAGIPQAIGMSLYKNLSYDMAKDLAPVTQAATFPSLIAVHPSLPVKSIRELLTLAKSRPGELNYGANTGSPNHLGMELLNVKMTFIPYKGAGPVVTDLVAGHIQLASLGFPGSLPFVQAGRLRAIAVTAMTRSPLLPEVPTVSESGVPGYQVTSWYGVFAPAGTPREIIARLNGDTAAALKAPDVADKLAKVGAEVATTTPEEFGRIVQDEIKKWAAVVKATGVTSE
jgi:tripartite-type tricarboxylate transporter receptor subunit TctC